MIKLINGLYVSCRVTQILIDSYLFDMIIIRVKFGLINIIEHLYIDYYMCYVCCYLDYLLPRALATQYEPIRRAI